MAFSEKHKKWINCKTRSIIFEFLKPQKEFEKPKKVVRIRKKLKTMKDCDVEE